MKKVVIIVVCLLIIVGAASYAFFTKHEVTMAAVLLQAKESLPDASWGKPQDATEPTPLGNLTGVKLSATTTTSQATLPHFENTKDLERLGYKPDMSLSADGPGSSVWGYTKTENGDESVILFSYNTQPSSSNPNEPLQFNCPCKMNISVFVSNPFKASTTPTPAQTGLANPASVNCAKVGGTDEIKTLANGAQYGLCQFGDNMACEEWALLRGDCPVGGIKTTGYDNMGQKYCAWLGGKTLAVPNSQCTLPGGKVCSTEALYNGTCSN